MLRASLRGASFLVTTLEWHSVDAVQSEPPNPGPTGKPSDEDPVIQLLEIELAALRDILNQPERFSPTEPRHHTGATRRTASGYPAPGSCTQRAPARVVAGGLFSPEGRFANQRGADRPATDR